MPVKAMTILLAMPWDQSQGGVTHVATSLGRQLQARGHRVLFLFPEETWRVRPRTSRQGFEAVGARLRNYPEPDQGPRAWLSWGSTLATTLPQLIRLGRRLGVDLVNLHYPGAGFAVLADLARHLSVPLVVSVHGSDLLTDAGPCRDAGLMRLLHSADAVVAPSRSYLSEVLRAYPELERNARYIYNGFDEAEFPVPSQSHSHPPGPERVALCIAAHSRKKGIDVLLRAMQQLGPDSGLRVRLIGDGPLSQELRLLASSLGVSDQVHFLGTRGRAQVFEELARCDLLVMPSRHASESFGLATLEAMACGKPVVASAIGGLSEVVEDGTTGVLVPPDDPEALALALRTLAADEALRRRLGDAGRQRALRFTVRQTGAEYEALFHRLVTRKPPAA